VVRLGHTSVTYELGLFRDGEPDDDGDGNRDSPAALGRWVHVYIDRDTRRPTPIPGQLRAAMESARA
jgi:acyl-CoA thioester hydrolase